MARPARSPSPTSTSPTEALPRIVAIAFASSERAHEAFSTAVRLADQELMTLHDAVFVQRDPDGTVEVEPAVHAAPVAAAVPSSLFGALIGTLIAGPLGLLVGGVIAGGGGALAAKLIETGIPHRIVVELQELTRPGQTVLALMVSEVAGMAVIEELRRFQGAHVIYAQLPPAALEIVRETLADHPA